MEYYIKYINFNAIALGDLAVELGDYRLASAQYSRALYRLREYQGDSMTAINIGAELADKIERYKNIQVNAKPVLSFDNWKLTKTSFVKGKQCIKMLYLDAYKKEARTPFDKETLKIFKQGRSFEEHFREMEFPEGLDVKKKAEVFSYLNSYTNYLLQQENTPPLFEATLIEEEVLVMCDVLVKDKSGDIHVYEIKLNSSIDEAIENDLAIQYWVCRKRFGEKLKSFNLVLRKSDTEKEYTIAEMSERLIPKMDEVENQVKILEEILSGEEPQIAMSEQCYQPYKCQFIEYCTKLASK